MSRTTYKSPTSRMTHLATSPWVQILSAWLVVSLLAYRINMLRRCLEIVSFPIKDMSRMRHAWSWKMRFKTGTKIGLSLSREKIGSYLTTLKISSRKSMMCSVDLKGAILEKWWDTIKQKEGFKRRLYFDFGKISIFVV